MGGFVVCGVLWASSGRAHISPVHIIRTTEQKLFLSMMETSEVMNPTASGIVVRLV